MGKQKFYVVWEGGTPGIYTSWTECQLQTKGYEGAKYKSFSTHEEAERAFHGAEMKNLLSAGHMYSTVFHRTGITATGGIHCETVFYYGCG